MTMKQTYCILIIMPLILAGCGQTGPLYLPEKPENPKLVPNTQTNRIQQPHSNQPTTPNEHIQQSTYNQQVGPP